MAQKRKRSRRLLGWISQLIDCAQGPRAAAEAVMENRDEVGRMAVGIRRDHDRNDAAEISDSPGQLKLREADRFPGAIAAFFYRQRKLWDMTSDSWGRQQG
ncbi:hypothetical protein Trisim1_001837 [Trichoderma cf. simile WF8]